MYPGASSALSIRYRQPAPIHVDALTRFFDSLIQSGDHVFFHPHPLTREEAIRRTTYRGSDLYFLQFADDVLSGYGMLRGWDAGYEIPSLGIAIHPEARGQGLAEDFLHFLHFMARQQGASVVRLTVHKDNARAVQLYGKLGYRFCRINSEVMEGKLGLGVDHALGEIAGKPMRR